MVETYGGDEIRGEKIINKYATHSMDQSLKAQRFFIADKILKKFSFKSALDKVIELSGLLEMPFLFGCYQKEFSKLAAETYSFDDYRYRAYEALWGLAMPGYRSVKIPISDAIREHATAGNPGLAPEHFTLTDIRPLENLSTQLYKWNEEFEKYFTQVKKIESGESDIILDHLNFENPYKLRYDVAVNVTRDLKAEISRLLKQPVKNPVETVERNKKLRSLIAEVTLWPWTLQSFAWRDLRDLREELGKAKDSFAKLILDYLAGTEYGEPFNFAEFDRKIHDYYWAELFALVKDAGQKKVLEIIKLEMEALTQNG